jgi:hypothetical protein
MRHCWFCDAPISKSTASREHVVPQWLQGYLRISNHEIEPTLTSLPDGAKLKKRRHPVSQLKTGGICNACNNGWMSQLENGCRPILLKLLNASVELSGLRRAGRLSLSRWAAKTAYALDAGGLERRVPKSHFTSFHENVARLPENVAVFITFHQPTREWYFASGGTWRHTPLSGSAAQRVSEESYKIVLQLGRIIFIIAHWPLKAWNFRVEREQLFKLWPVTSQTAVYVHPSPMNSDTSENACLRHDFAITVSPTRKAEGRA